MRPQHRHWLAENESERSPRRLYFWDTEGRPIGDGKTQELRCWVGRSVLRKGIQPKAPRETQHEGTGALALALDILSYARSDTPLYVCAHGASYDLTITRLPLLLMEQGWELGQHALTSGQPWAHYRLGGKTIRLIDSHSFLPRSLEQIGDSLGIPKLALPDFDADDEEWFARCRQDVEITARSMLQLLDWWDRKRLGAWADTGPNTGWHAMRHRKAPDKVLIDPDPDGRAFDRQAIYGGRRDAWYRGILPEGWYVELDLVQAHLSICASMALPVRRVSTFESQPLDTHLLDHLGIGIIAEAEIETQVPRYPLRLKHSICYPVGHFKTVLCAPELAYARELGELRSIGPGRRYQLGFAMEGWGQWIQRILEGTEPDTPIAAQIAAKGWSRTVVGRWAMRTGRQDFELPSYERGWGVSWGRDHTTGAPRTILTMGGREMWLVQDQEADSNFPAVLGWVQSYTRVLLDRLISELPPGSVVLCNTDGVLARAEEICFLGGWPAAATTPQTTVRELASYAAEFYSQSTRPARVQVKAVYRSGEVIGPQHSVMDGQRKLAGVRSNAKEIRPKVYAYQTWPRLAAQMAMGETGGYRLGEAAVDLSGVKVARWEYQDGCCEPLRLAVRPENGGASVCIPWGACPRHGAPLQPAQHPDLPALSGYTSFDLGPGQPALAVGDRP